MNEAQITIWKIPILGPLVQPIDFVYPMRKPSYSVAVHPAPSGNSAIYPTIIRYHHRSESSLSRFDILNYSANTLNSYTMKALRNDPSDGFPSCLPIFLDSIDVGDSWMAQPCSVWLEQDRQILLVWVEVDQSHVMMDSFVLSVDAEHPTVQHGSGILWAQPQESYFDDTMYDFCPLSGRVCVCQGREIRVMDYLLNPS